MGTTLSMMYSVQARALPTYLDTSAIACPDEQWSHRHVDIASRWPLHRGASSSSRPADVAKLRCDLTFPPRLSIGSFLASVLYKLTPCRRCRGCALSHVVPWSLPFLPANPQRREGILHGRTPLRAGSAVCEGAFSPIWILCDVLDGLSLFFAFCSHSHRPCKAAAPSSPHADA